jgi:hypothetical protein
MQEKYLGETDETALEAESDNAFTIETLRHV